MRFAPGSCVCQGHIAFFLDLYHLDKVSVQRPETPTVVPGRLLRVAGDICLFRLPGKDQVNICIPGASHFMQTRTALQSPCQFFLY